MILHNWLISIIPQLGTHVYIHGLNSEYKGCNILYTQ